MVNTNIKNVTCVTERGAWVPHVPPKSASNELNFRFISILTLTSAHTTIVLTQLEHLGLGPKTSLKHQEQ